MRYKKFWWKGHEFLFNGETADGVDSVAANMGELHPMLGFAQKCDSHDEHDRYAAADRILEMYPRWIEQWEEENQTCAECGQSLENHKLGRTVHITGLTQPEDGCSIAIKCPVCNRVEIAWSPLATKPKDGGTFWVIGINCYDHHATAIWFFNPDKLNLIASGWKPLPEVTHGN